MTRLPCWLSPEALTVAAALLEAGYVYCGTTDEFYFYEEYSVRCGEWRIAGDPGGCVLDAEWNGALFSLCLEVQKNPDSKREIKRVKKLIRQTKKAFNEAISEKYYQLSLFSTTISFLPNE